MGSESDMTERLSLSHHPQHWKTENISSKTTNKKRMSTLTTTKHTFESSSHSNQRRKEIKNTNWKKLRLSLFTDGILYIEHPKDATK